MIRAYALATLKILGGLHFNIENTTSAVLLHPIDGEHRLVEHFAVINPIVISANEAWSLLALSGNTL